MNWQLDQCYREGCKLEREHNKVKENAERYRLDANRLEAEVMILKEKLKEYDDTLTVCTDNFSCKTFVPQKWELPPYQ
jgi:phage host-nuclease inhibitor protein Gam